MSNFDPITYSAVNQLKPFIGQPIMVPQNYYDDKYLETGTFVDPVAYPRLAATMVGNTNPAETITVTPSSSLPTFSNVFPTALSQLGTIALTFEYNNRFYILFASTATSSYRLYGTTNSNLSTLTFIRSITQTEYNNITLPIGYKTPTNNRIYLSTNKYLDLAAFANPSNPNFLVDMVITGITNAAGWLVLFGNGIYVGTRLVGTTMPGGLNSNTIIYSSDGVNFTATSASYIITSPVAGFAFGAGRFVIMVQTTNFFADNTIVYSSNGITWTSTRPANNGTVVAAGGLDYSSTAGCFINTCQEAAFYYHRSVDGVTWTEVAISIPSGSRSGSIKLLPNGNFITAKSWTSADGNTWTFLDTTYTDTSKDIGKASYIVGTNGSSWYAFGLSTFYFLTDFSNPSNGGQLFVSTSNSAFATWSSTVKLYYRRYRVHTRQP